MAAPSAGLSLHAKPPPKPVAAGGELLFLGNDPQVLLRVACSQALQVKALTLAAAFVCLITAGVWFAFLRSWWEFAEAQGHPVTPNNTTHASLSADFWNLPTPSAVPMFWYLILHTGVMATFAAGVATALPWAHSTNWRLVRWDRAVILFLLPFLLFIVIALRGSAMASNSLPNPQGTLFTFSIAASASLLPPTLLSAASSAPLLRGKVLAPVTVGLVAFLATGVLGFVASSLLIPAFAAASPLGRVLLRLLAWPLLGEAALALVRMSAWWGWGRGFPGDRVLLPLIVPAVIVNMLGRFLTTVQSSLAGTVLVSLALAAVELVLRSTMLMRDRAYAAACGRCCGSRPGGLPPGRDTRMHFAMLQLDTTAEDAGIWLSLIIALLFRLPGVPGGAPLSTADVVVRVGVQFVVEACTDVGFAAVYAGAAVCCGVKHSPVPKQALAQGFYQDGVEAGAVAVTDDVPLVDDAAGTSPTASGNPTGMPTATPATGQPHGELGMDTSDSWAYFWSCRSLCIDPAHPAVAAQLRAIDTELAEELEQEEDAVWSPVTLARMWALGGGGRPAWWGAYLTVMAEATAVRFIATWRAPFKDYNTVFLLSVAAGASWSINTLVHAVMCPMGSGEAPGDWHFDFCAGQ